MAISFMCPDCGTVFRVPDDLAGQKARCPDCQSKFKVPNRLPEQLFAQGGVGGAASNEPGADRKDDAAAKAGAASVATGQRGLNIWGLIGAFALIAATFLPALQLPGGESFALFQTPSEYAQLGLNVVDGQSAAPEIRWFALVFLIPLFAVIALVREFWTRAGDRGVNPRIAYLLAFLSPAIVGIAMMITLSGGNLAVDAPMSLFGQIEIAIQNLTASGDAADATLMQKVDGVWSILKMHLAPGAYCLGVGAVLCLLGAIVAPKPRAASSTAASKSANDSGRKAA